MREFKAQLFVVCYALLLLIGIFGRIYLDKILMNIVDYDTLIGKTIYLIVLSVITVIFYFGGTFLCCLLIAPTINAYVHLFYVICVDFLFALMIVPSSDTVSLILYMIFIASTVTPVILRINTVNKKPPIKTTWRIKD